MLRRLQLEQDPRQAGLYRVRVDGRLVLGAAGVPRRWRDQRSALQAVCKLLGLKLLGSADSKGEAFARGID
jgi:hypothetical protein